MQLPLEFEQRMKDMLGVEYDAFRHAFTQETLHTGIRVSSLKRGAREAVLAQTGPLMQVPWCGEGYYADKTVLSGSHPYHLAGLFYFQEPSAMSAVEALDIAEGDYILDLCAAPGGKSTQAGSRLHGTGLLVTNEIIPKRADILAENIERFGIANALVTNESPQKLADKFPRFFDKIIVDAPCSGEGMFRKEPQAAEQWSVEHTQSCAARARRIIDCAVSMLADGGYLVYSTCTFAPCENEGMVEYILDTYPELELCPIPRLSMLSPGESGYIASARDLSAARRIYPHKQDGEGHFIALFHRKGEWQNHIVRMGKETCKDDRMPLFRTFEQSSLNKRFEGRFTVFGDNLYLMPEAITDIDRLKIVRCGLHLGVFKKGRFEPSHALALALTAEDAVNTMDLRCESEVLKQYLRGETVPCEKTGWVLVMADGFPLGWGKGAGGVLKNHFPKHLRWKR